MFRDDSGHFLSGCEQKLLRWVEHFDRLLNRPLTEPIHVTSPDDAQQYEIGLGFPDELETTSAVQTLKNKKSPDKDGILPETFKSCLRASLSSLNKLCCRI